MDGAEVPKFGSFKLKSVKKTEVKSDTVTGEHASGEAGKHHSVRRSRDRAEPSREKSRNPHFELGTYARWSKHSGADSSEHRISERSVPETSHLFLVDRRGDYQNVQFESIHRFEIPHYHRAGYGVVLGSSPLAKVDKSTSTDRAVYLIPDRAKQSTDVTRPLLSKRNKHNRARYRFITSTLHAHDGLDVDFVEFEGTHKRRRLSTEPEDAEARRDGTDYRSIEGKAKVPKTSDADLTQIASDSELEGEYLDLEQAARQENSRLLRIARAELFQIDAWLELVAHQAQVVLPGVELTSMTTSQRQSVADLRLSILNEALKRASTEDHRSILHAEIIKEGSLVWDRTKLEKKWQETLFNHPNHFKLHLTYLDHVQTDPTTYRFEQCRLVYSQCFKAIKASNDASHNSQVQTISLLTRLVSFVRDSGYDELATAIWQAVLEFRFFRPAHPTHSDDQAQLLAAFETFWESDVPRIGEAGATGWKDFNEDRPGTKRPLEEQSLGPLVSLKTFAEDEIQLCSTGIFPASIDDDNAADPFRFVMFKDIEEILVHLGGDLPENVLLNAFLATYGLPTLVIGDAKEPVPEYVADPIVTKHEIGYFMRSTSNSSEVKSLATSRRETTFSHFHNGFNSFKDRTTLDAQDGPNLITFLDRSLGLLMSALPSNEALAEYTLAWKLHMFPDIAAKTAKQLLKSRPTSLRLYNGFALVEAALGRLNKAKNVWSTALQMSSSLASDAQVDTILLRHSSMLTFAQHGDEETALLNLLGIADRGSGVSHDHESHQWPASRHLRSRQVLESEFDRTLFAKDTKRATLYADCLVWLAYLRDHDIPTALESYRRYGNRIVRDASAQAAELLAQSKVVLLDHHLRCKRPFKPALWTDELQKDLERHAQNVMLLDLHAQMASHDRLRGIVKEQASHGVAEVSTVEWQFRISREIQHMHLDGSGSNINTVRALFNRALLNSESDVKNSPELWTLWLRIEYQYAEGRPSDTLKRAKQVFLQGLRHLPWYKPWALLGMKLLSGKGLLESEIRQVYETMLERGLRVRIDLDD